MNKKVLILPLFVLGCFSCNKKDVYYKVKWINFNGDILKEDDVLKDTLPKFDLESPKRPDDENYVYKFNGWDPEVTPASKDTTYTAKYKSIEKCDLIFKDYDGTILSTISSNVEEKDKVEYEGKVPYRPNDGEVYYYFDSWKEEKEHINKKEFLFTPTFKTCAKDDDQDNDGIPDYLDPYPKCNETNLQMDFIYREGFPTVSIKNAKVKMDYINMFVSDDAKIDIYNKDISVLGSIINNDSYVTRYGKLKENGKIKSRKEYENIFYMLGCDKVEMISLPRDYIIDKNDYCSVVAAHKKVKYQNQERDFIFLVMEQHYKYIDTWKSNFDMGYYGSQYFEKEGYIHEQCWKDNPQFHKGFYVTANRLYEEKLKNYLSQYDNPVVFLTGHSRGGGIANILGNILNNQHDLPMKLFVYTYAAPNTYFGEKADENNKNIFNIINGDDFVPAFPFSTWSDGDKYGMKFGTNIVIPLSKYKEDYKNITGNDYSFVTDGVDTVKKGIKMKREDVYKLKESGYSEHFLTKDGAETAIENYKQMLLSAKVSSYDIEKYFDFKIEEGYLSYKLNFYNTIAGGFKIAVGILDGGTLPDVTLLLNLFFNYKTLALDLALKGLSIDSVAVPHYLTSYYLITSF